MLRLISSLMETDLAENAPGMVTFTQVRVTGDLRQATVYYSFLGDEAGRESVAGYFERNRHQIRHLVGTNLRLRRVPELRFKFDPSIEEGIKIERLLNEIDADRTEQRDD